MRRLAVSGSFVGRLRASIQATRSGSLPFRPFSRYRARPAKPRPFITFPITRFSGSRKGPHPAPFATVHCRHQRFVRRQRGSGGAGRSRYDRAGGSARSRCDCGALAAMHRARPDGRTSPAEARTRARVPSLRPTRARGSGSFAVCVGLRLRREAFSPGSDGEVSRESSRHGEGPFPLLAPSVIRSRLAYSNDRQRASIPYQRRGSARIQRGSWAAAMCSRRPRRLPQSTSSVQTIAPAISSQ
jgi:hypothetical protein